MKKLKIWVEDLKATRALISQITERDGKWRMSELKNGQYEVTFCGAEGSSRATLFKLTYVEPKPGTRDTRAKTLDEIRYLIKMVNAFSWDDDPYKA